MGSHEKVLKLLISNADFYTAESAKEAYDILMGNNEAPFDIIITDMQMEYAGK